MTDDDDDKKPAALCKPDYKVNKKDNEYLESVNVFAVLLLLLFNLTLFKCDEAIRKSPGQMVLLF